MWQGLPSGGSCWHSNATNLKVKMIYADYHDGDGKHVPDKAKEEVEEGGEGEEDDEDGDPEGGHDHDHDDIQRKKKNSQTLRLLDKHRHPGSVLVSISMEGCKPLSKEQSPSQMFQMLWYRVDDDGLELMAIFQTP